jgi:hypothetical protein
MVSTLKPDGRHQSTYLSADSEQRTAAPRGCAHTHDPIPLQLFARNQPKLNETNVLLPLALAATPNPVCTKWPVCSAGRSQSSASDSLHCAGLRAATYDYDTNRRSPRASGRRSTTGESGGGSRGSRGGAATQTPARLRAARAALDFARVRAVSRGRGNPKENSARSPRLALARQRRRSSISRGFARPRRCRRPAHAASAVPGFAQAQRRHMGPRAIVRGWTRKSHSQLSMKKIDSSWLRTSNPLRAGGARAAASGERPGPSARPLRKHRRADRPRGPGPGGTARSPQPPPGFPRNWGVRPGQLPRPSPFTGKFRRPSGEHGPKPPP